MKTTRMILLAMLVALTASVAAQAQPTHLMPGSALVFPNYNVSKGEGTIVCITNTNTDETYCEDEDFKAGDVVVHYIYIDGDNWLEFDRYELLTPGDTFCIISGRHLPDGGRGFLVAVACDPTDIDTRIKFDYLIGSAVVVESQANMLWQYTPYSFIGRPTIGEPAACARVTTDISPTDDYMDFDGLEYSEFPGMLYVDSFFEESGQFDDRLTLMSLSGANYTNELSLLFWNNVEQKFSRTFRFTCWWTGQLTEISSIAGNLGGTPGDDAGTGNFQNGWLSIEPRKVLDGAGNPVEDAVPAILGVFRTRIGTSAFAAGKALHFDPNAPVVEGKFEF